MFAILVKKKSALVPCTIGWVSEQAWGLWKCPSAANLKVLVLKS